MTAAITIEVLHAAKGDAIWIECARDGRPWWMVVDGGPPQASEALHERVDRLSPGERSVDVAVVSHLDSDHIGAMLPLVDQKAREVTESAEGSSDTPAGG